jgi:single-stranded DNA-binding protein
MANIQDAFPSNYLKASDLKGAQPIVTIDRVEFEAVGRQREMKPVVYFVGKEKGIVLNKTNANNITNIAGSAETDDWNGVRVKLYATHVEFQGETVEAIRVKAAPPQTAKPAGRQTHAPAPQPPAREPGDDDAPIAITDDDIPF